LAICCWASPSARCCWPKAPLHRRCEPLPAHIEWLLGWWRS
jgi:hypothetical protein